jgi:hypothetical protein
MPSYPPRNNSIKKKQELDYIGFQLFLLVSKKESEAKIKKMAEKFRKAKLSLLNAEFHLETKGLEIDDLKNTKFQNEVKYGNRFYLNSLFKIIR